MALKDTHGFLNETDNYNTIRRLIRHIYLYGTFSKSDFISSNILGIKERSLADYFRRVDNYLNSAEFSEGEVLLSHNIPGRKTDKKSSRIVKDPFKTSYNFLVSTFHQHTVSTADIVFYFYLAELYSASVSGADNLYPLLPDEVFEEYTSLYGEDTFTPLCNYSDFFTFEDLLTDMESLYECNSKLISILTNEKYKETEFPLSKEQILARINELASLGIITPKDEKYIIAGNLFSEDLFFNPDNKDPYISATSLMDLLSFFKADCLLSVPGFFLEEKIGTLSTGYFSDFSEENDNYRYKGRNDSIIHESSFKHAVIDNDVIWALINSIHSLSPINFIYQTGTIDEVEKKSAMPIKLMVDSYFGRVYLFAYEYLGSVKGSYTLLRTDRIFDIETCEADDKTFAFLKGFRTDLSPAETHSLLSAAFTEKIENTWNTTINCNSPKNVKVFFTLDPKTDKVLIDYLYQFESCGTITELTSGEYSHAFNATVNSTSELIPWLNTFGDKAVVSKEDSPEFYNEMKSYSMELMKLYESV